MSNETITVDCSKEQPLSWYTTDNTVSIHCLVSYGHHCKSRATERNNRPRCASYPPYGGRYCFDRSENAK